MWEQYMEKHYGQIVEFTVRRTGCSITQLATELGVNRRTLYNYFQNKDLKSEVIYNIGVLIHHDFSKELPELFTGDEFLKANTQEANSLNDKHPSEDSLWKNKYITLLENYNRLLENEV